MDVLLFVLAVLYVAITLAVAVVHLADYHTYKRFSEEEFQRPSRRQEYAEESRQAAARFRTAPLWPLLFLGLLAEALAAGRKR